jgi:di- and tripeptidase
MLLARLTGPNGRVEIPSFYDPILEVTEAEKDRYVAITSTLLRRNPALGDRETLTASLMQRWREASLTIHRFKVSGPEHSTIIPRRACAAISLRLVPSQEASVVKQSLVAFLEACFAELGTKNHLSVKIDHEADPWLGDPENAIYQILEEAIVAVWGSTVASSLAYQPPTPPSKAIGQPPSPATSSTLSHAPGFIPSASLPPPSYPTAQDISHPAVHSSERKRRPFKPLYIREGGSIPSIRFLEKEFNAPAAHLPCGQASDSAHLDNERLRLVNLYKSREIFKRVFGMGMAGNV